jgi:hypothetical protein
LIVLGGKCELKTSLNNETTTTVVNNEDYFKKLYFTLKKTNFL